MYEMKAVEGFGRVINVQYGKEKISFLSEGYNPTENSSPPVSSTAHPLNFYQSTVATLKEALLQWSANTATAITSSSSSSSSSAIRFNHIEEIKLILNGKILSNHDQPLIELFLTQTESSKRQQQQQLLKITMIANPLTKETIHQLEEERQRQQDQLSKQKMKRKLRSSDSKNNNTREKRPIVYGFHRITTLANLPNETKAKEILQQLANDSGIIAVMNKYKFAVNELTELYPEGHVGVSDVCVMGLNQNHGQKILLRLRTDDLKGFRKFLSIKKVLFHELAHNLYSEHDNNFYMLMRQIEQDANELAWEKSKGYSLLSSSQRERYIRAEKHFSDDENEEEEQTVFTLGGNAAVAPPSTLPASRVAGEAAILRFHQFQKQQEEQQYNQYVKSTSIDAELSDDFVSDRKNVDGKEQFIVADEDQTGSSGSDSENHNKADEVENTKMEIDESTTSIIDFTAPSSLGGTSEILQEIILDAQSTPTVEPSETTSKTFLPLEAQDLPSISAVIEDKKQRIESMFEDSIAMILSDESLISTIEKTLAIKDIIIRILTRLQEQPQTQKQTDGFQQFIQIIQLFVTVLQNIQNHPYEEKYKRIKKSNKLFQRTLEGMEDSLSILYQSGFEEQIQSNYDQQELFYRKNDTGLLYLIKSILESIITICKA